MLKSAAKQLLAAFLLLCVTSLAFSDTATEVNTSESAAASGETDKAQTAVVVLTDPEIAAVEDEEPDCE